MLLIINVDNQIVYHISQYKKKNPRYDKQIDDKRSIAYLYIAKPSAINIKVLGIYVELGRKIYLQDHQYTSNQGICCVKDLRNVTAPNIIHHQDFSVFIHPKVD